MQDVPLAHTTTAFCIIILNMQRSQFLSNQINIMQTSGFKTINIPDTEAFIFCQYNLACTTPETHLSVTGSNAVD
jgi:hypothetical protein